MTFLAIPAVSRVGNIVEIVCSVSESIDRQIGFKRLTRVNLVNQGLEMNRFRRSLVRWATGLVVTIRVVAEHTVLNFLSNGAMQSQGAVAAVASLLCHDHSSGHWGLVCYRKGKRLVVTDVANGGLVRSSRLQRDVAEPFNSNGETTLCIGGDSFLESVGDDTAAAGRSEKTFAPVRLRNRYWDRQ